MAKKIVLSLAGEESSFSFKPIERSLLYGKKRRLNLDKDGENCSRGTLLGDGSLLLKSGMTGQGYFLDDGTFLKQSDLEGFNFDGTALEKVPSTLDVSQSLEGPVDPSEVLDLKIKTIYGLTEEHLGKKLKQSLLNGEIFSFIFNYREDYHAEKAFILGNENGYFVLIGNPVQHNWLSLDVAPIILDQEIEDSEEIDFEML
jgi:hypothetical protein